MILDALHDFGSFEGRVWLDCAHQAPLPNIARAEAEEAVAWKAARPPSASAGFPVG
jgi:hypothetical protein